MNQLEVFRTLVDVRATYAELDSCAVHIEERISDSGYNIRIEELGSCGEYIDLYIYEREKDEIIQHETI